VTSAWAGADYHNPYYEMPVATSTVAAPAYNYDYSQPVIVQDYSQQQVYNEQDVALESPTNAAPPLAQASSSATRKAERALEKFDWGLAAFKRGKYERAVERFNEALRLTADDPMIHEVRALALFALGDYNSAAAALNALLAIAPGMDWTTLSGLYGNVDDYTEQLRRLEAQCEANPRDAAAQFVLAYQYLVIGQAEDAVQALRAVVAVQPKDATARYMLESLAPADEATVADTTPAPPTPSGVQQASASKLVPPQVATADTAGAQAALVGRWRATADGATIELSIDDRSQFEWSATPKGGKASRLSGNVLATRDTLVLESATQGTMVGKLTSIGRDAFRFALAGGPTDAKGLEFQRIR
jgi:tetratricopeptide (TPR) repeat protein